MYWVITYVLKPEFALLIHLSESVRSFRSLRNIPGSEITQFFCLLSVFMYINLLIWQIAYSLKLYLLDCVFVC